MLIVESTRRSFTSPEGVGKRLLAAVPERVSAALLVGCASCLDSSDGFTWAANATERSGAGMDSAAKANAPVKAAEVTGATAGIKFAKANGDGKWQ
jgi:hypothetical protein